MPNVKAPLCSPFFFVGPSLLIYVVTVSCVVLSTGAMPHHHASSTTTGSTTRRRFQNGISIALGEGFVVNATHIAAEHLPLLWEDDLLGGLPPSARITMRSMNLSTNSSRHTATSLQFCHSVPPWVTFGTSLLFSRNRVRVQSEYSVSAAIGSTTSSASVLVALCGIAVPANIDVYGIVETEDNVAPQHRLLASVPIWVSPGRAHQLAWRTNVASPWSLWSFIDASWRTSLPPLFMRWTDAWGNSNTGGGSKIVLSDVAELTVDWWMGLSVTCSALGNRTTAATGRCLLGQSRHAYACNDTDTGDKVICVDATRLMTPSVEDPCMDAVRAVIRARNHDDDDASSSRCGDVLGTVEAQTPLNNVVAQPIEIAGGIAFVVLKSATAAGKGNGIHRPANSRPVRLDAVVGGRDGAPIVFTQSGSSVLLLPCNGQGTFSVVFAAVDAEGGHVSLGETTITAAVQCSVTQTAADASVRVDRVAAPSVHGTSTFVWNGEECANWDPSRLARLDCTLLWPTVPTVKLRRVWTVLLGASNESNVSTTASPQSPAPLATTTAAPGTTPAPPAVCDCQSLTQPLELTSDSRNGLGEIPSWFQSNGKVFPLVVVQWTFPKFSSSSCASFFPTTATRWTLVPNPRYLDVPLGLLASFAFGASYCKIGRVSLVLSRPLCGGGPLSGDMSSNNVEWKQAAASFLDTLISNVTAATMQSSYASIDAAQPNVASCFTDYGTNEINLWDLTCVAKQQTALDPSSSVAANGTAASAVFSESSGPAAGAVVVVVIGVLCSFGCGFGVLWYAWFTMSNQLQHKVKLTNRKLLPLAVKWRIALAHLLAPFTCIAHAYTIFNLRALTVGEVLFGLDLLFPVLFFVATAIRVVLPGHRVTTPVYLGGVLLLLFYTCFLLGGATLWAFSALSIDVRVIPYATAGSLILLQASWQIKNCGEQLMPSVSLISRHLARTGTSLGVGDDFTAANAAGPSNFVQTVAPINNALGLELFAIVMLLFMFAVTQVEDISAFMAVMASFVMVAYSFIANYSITRQVEEALSGALSGNEDDMMQQDDGAAADEEDDAHPPPTPAEALLSRVLRHTTTSIGRHQPFQKELTRLTRRMTHFDNNTSITSSQSRATRGGGGDENISNDVLGGRTEASLVEDSVGAHHDERCLLKRDDGKRDARRRLRTLRFSSSSSGGEEDATSEKKQRKKEASIEIPSETLLARPLLS